MVLQKRRVLSLWMAATLAAIPASAFSATGHAPALFGAPVKSAVSAIPDKEEVITRLIIKPRKQLGTKLAHALQQRDASGLSKAANRGMQVLRPMSGGAHVVKLDKGVALSEARLIAKRLMQDGEVELAEPDRLMHASAVPNDPGYASKQWHYFAPGGANQGGANLPGAWDTTTGNPAITVAVLDTGYRQHADIAAVLPGYDFISTTIVSNDGDGRDADAQDPGDWVAANECGAGESESDSSWHGTHVMGTIAASMNNTLAVGVNHGAGIAPGIRILPVRVLGKCGGFTSDIVDGMHWAANTAVIGGVPANAHPAHVLNMSLGFNGACPGILQSAVTTIVNAGKIIVAATGNGATVSVGSPANCIGVIAVTAHSINGDNAHYADIGAQSAISAPGGGCGTLTWGGGCADGSAAGLLVYSLLNTGSQGPVADNYVSRQGTSMATPHVSGVVALMLSVNPALTPAQVRSYLQSSARPHPAGTTCTQSPYTGLCGAGLLDAQAALASVANLPPTISLAPAGQVVVPGVTVSLSSAVTPAAGRVITTYAWVQLSGAAVGTVSNANTANATFAAPATGTYTFQLTVTDDAAQSSTALATVRVNSAPVLTAVAAQAGAVGQAISFNVGATDADGDFLRFYATGLPSGATLSAAGAFHWASPAAGSYSLTYYARDNDVSSTQGVVSITVSGAAPAASGGGGGGSLDWPLVSALALLTIACRVSRAKKSRHPFK